MGSLVSQWLLATLAYPQCKQPQSTMQPDTYNPCAEVALGRWQDPGPRFSRELCSFLCEPQPPTQPLTLPVMASASKAKRGTSPWLLPLREAKHVAELQGNSGHRLLPLARRNLCRTPLPWASLQHLLCKATARSGGRCENKTAVLPWRNKHQNPAACQRGCRWSCLTAATQSCFSSCEFNKSSIKITTLIYKSRQAKWHFYHRAHTTRRFPDAAANQCNLHYDALFSLQHVQDSCALLV